MNDIEKARAKRDQELMVQCWLSEQIPESEWVEYLKFQEISISIDPELI
jgi:hypothetical protein